MTIYRIASSEIWAKPIRFFVVKNGRIFSVSSGAYPEYKTGDFIEACEIVYKPLENPQLLRDNLPFDAAVFGEERRMGGAQRGTHQTVHQSPMSCAALPHVL
ncbi:MAG: hypothetical protein Q7S46_00360 [Gallionella sp.]|nr:hypothetical protein [Gallionella sp.]